MLGVPSSASEKELSRAYKKLAKEHHPDANAGNAKAEERFKEVNAAYDVLGDAEKRKEYDEVRRMVASGVGPGGYGGGAGYGSNGMPFDVDFGAGGTAGFTPTCSATCWAGAVAGAGAAVRRAGTAARARPRDGVAPLVRRRRARRHQHRAVPRRRVVLDVSGFGRGARHAVPRRVRSVTATVRSRSTRDRSRSRRSAPRAAGAGRSCPRRAPRARAAGSRSRAGK